VSEAEAVVTKRKRPAGIWLVPIVAFVLGIWMVVYNYMNEGPTIYIEVATAQGIEAGKTKVRALEVVIGLVEEVRLKDDLSGVVVTAKLDKEAAHLLREDSEFWMVVARIGTGGISGLGTILSGGYMQLTPGTGKTGRRRFVALEDPPVTPLGTPGLNVTLISDRTGSVSQGDAVVYKGYKVGRVEKTRFDPDTRKVNHDVFVNAPYDTLVNSATRFYNVSGVSVHTSPDGVKIDLASLETLVMGGVSFGVPEGVPDGGPVESGTQFRLYRNHESMSDDPYKHGLELVVAFRSSVRGLTPGAPVEYRGIRVGTVKRLMVKELVAAGLQTKGDPIPVLIRIEPGRYEIGDTADAVALMRREIEVAVKTGMRANLETGNLITGALFIGLDYYPDEAPMELADFAGYPMLPSVESGLDQLTKQVGEFLDKLNDMPLDQTVVSVNTAVVQLETTLATLNDVLVDVRAIAGSDGAQNLPADLQATLQQLTETLNAYSGSSPFYGRMEQTLNELNATLHNIQRLARRLEDKPNAIIFSGSPAEDPEPQVGSP
jgi:paraquat-inducible protein B